MYVHMCIGALSVMIKHLVVKICMCKPAVILVCSKRYHELYVHMVCSHVAAMQLLRTVPTDLLT